MHENPTPTNSVAPSRRGLFALAAGAVLSPAIGPSEALAQPTAFELPKATESVEPFKVSMPQTAIDDLKRRLALTRWPERETVSDWSQGVPLQKAQALIAYWRDKYNWRRFEARINAFPQYRTQIDGLGIHFIHVRSPQQNALPIILTHGWPGSVVEFMEVIGPGRGVPCRRAVAPGLWLLRQACRDGLGREQDRPRLGDADGTPWLRALGGAGRRLGGGRDARPGASAAPGSDRSPCELAVRLSRKAAAETHACRAKSHRPRGVIRQ